MKLTSNRLAAEASKKRERCGANTARGGFFLSVVVAKVHFLRLKTLL